MEAALYDPAGGFFARAGGAGRAGSDFITSVEVGSLFGALVARAVDGWWDGLGRPDPFLVVDAGAGRGAPAPDGPPARAPRARGARHRPVGRAARPPGGPAPPPPPGPARA